MAETSGGEALPASEACPHCGGTGWQIADDGGAGTARPCECRKLYAARELLARAGIPERQRRCSFESFYTSNSTASAEVRQSLLAAKRASEHYVDHFIDPESGRFRSTGLLYTGPPGTGKTHLAVSVLKALIERYRVRGRFVNFSHLVYELQSTFDPSTAETRRQILDPITRAEVLVLDELGATKPTDWVQDQLYLIINERYVRDLPTLMTTNYRLAPVAATGKSPATATSSGHLVTDARIASDFADGTAPARTARSRPASRPAEVNPFADLDMRIAPMLVSRLYEMAKPIVLGGWDYRERVMSPRLRRDH